MMNKFLTALLTIPWCAVIIIFSAGCLTKDDHAESISKSSASAAIAWTAPDSSLIPRSEEGALIRYGRSLIANTTVYLGPKGKINHQSNGMNCQNCHLDAGTRAW